MTLSRTEMWDKGYEFGYNKAKKEKLWDDKDDEYFERVARVNRIEKFEKILKDYHDEIIYLQNKIKKLEVK